MNFNNQKQNLTRIKSQKFLILTLVAITIPFALRGSFTDEEFSWISVSTYGIIPGALAIISIMLVIKIRKNRDYHSKALMMFAGSVVSMFIAEQIWTIYDTVLEIDPFPSLADLFYLGAYPFYIVFFIFYLRPLKKAITKNVIVLATTLSILFLIPSALATYDLSAEDSLLEIGVALAYPIADTLLLIPALIGFFFLFKGERNYFWSLILVGILSMIIADTFFLLLTIDDTYFDGHPVDLFWLYGYILFAFALHHNKKQIALGERATQISSDNKIVDTIKFETITKMIIPLTLSLIMLITLISLAQMYYYQENSVRIDDAQILVTIGIVTMIVAFSIIIIMLSKNVGRFVDMKTKELQEKQNSVNKQLDKLKQIDKEKSEFLSMIAHELKSPMVPIKSYTDLLLINTSNLDEGQIKKLTMIQSSTNVLSQMISDLLDIQKIKHMQLTLKKEKHNLADLINRAIDENQLTADNNKIVFEKHLHDVYCKCDDTRVVQVLNNLITNAIKFTKDRITIKLDSQDGVATIRVKDNGIGLDVDKLEKIFTKFYQVDTSMTREHQGTGLGLSICWGIADTHNGKIWAESKGKNMGSEFYFQLPLGI